MKIQKKKKWGGGRLGSERGGGSGLGGQGGCERRIEVFVKIQKKKLGGGVGGIRVDVKEELKFLRKLKKKKLGGGVGLGGGDQDGYERRIEVLGKIHKQKNSGGGEGGRGSVAEGVRWGGQVGRGVRVDVNAMLGLGGDVGYGGC